MATSSLHRRPVVCDQQTAAQLAEVLENGTAPVQEPAVEYRELSGDEIRALYTD